MTDRLIDWLVDWLAGLWTNWLDWLVNILKIHAKNEIDFNADKND